VNEILFTDVISEIVDNRGRTCPVSAHGRPLIATNCIKEDALHPTYETTRFVSEETYQTWFRGHPEPGDIVFVCKGKPGTVALAPDPVDFCIAQDMVAVRADESKIYPKFLFALLRSRLIRERIDALHVGTMIPHFKKGDFDQLKLPMVERSLQVAIGDLYFDLSNKIESNRRLVDLLRRNAKAVAEDACSGRDKRRLSDMAVFQRGFGYKSSGFAESGQPMISMGCSERRGWLRRDKVRTYGDAVKEKYFVRAEQLLVVNVDLTWKLDVLGWPLLVPPDLDGAIISNDIFGIQFAEGDEWLSWVVWAELQTWSARSVIEGGAKGTTVASVGIDTLGQVEIRIPDSAIGRSAAESMSALIRRAWTAEQESGHLTTLRDALLPELLSGRLRVKDAEKVVEGAV
jgi:type I restriction enzyme S subunit